MNQRNVYAMERKEERVTFNVISSSLDVSVEQNSVWQLKYFDYNIQCEHSPILNAFICAIQADDVLNMKNRNRNRNGFTDPHKSRNRNSKTENGSELLLWFV